MRAYAFKRGDDSLIDRLIVHRTKGPFSHVEMWLDGPMFAARCFSSHIGGGCSFRIIDLTEQQWEIVHVCCSTRESIKVDGFCEGMNGRAYDLLGLLGIDTGHGEHDDRDRFCSEVCTEALQKCAGRWPRTKRWMVSPNDLHRMAMAL